MTMTRTRFKEQKFETLTIEMAISPDHPVRKLKDCIDWTFIYDIVEDTYSARGRKSIDPVVLFKIAFWNIYTGRNSIRRTCMDLQTDLAGRYFLDLYILDPIPNYSDLSQNYIRRFKDTNVFESIFNHILEQAYEHHLLDLSAVHIDSTHQKADANKNKKEKIFVEKVVPAYKEKLQETINEIREEHNQKPLKEVQPTELVFDEKTKEEIEVPVQEKKEIIVSTTDPECGVFNKGEHETCMAYVNHTVCDNRGIVLGVRTFPGNQHDSATMAETLDSLPEFLNGQIKNIALDAGYKTAAVAKQLADRGLIAYMPYKRPMTKKGFFKKSEYIYDAERDVYVCPNEQVLTYSTTNRNGYKEYKSDKSFCENCPLRSQCTASKNCTKVVTRHVWQEELDKVENRRNAKEWKMIYPRRKETIERVFAENKEHHNLRYTKLRGLEKNQNQALLIFACHNLLKIARWAK